MCHFCRKRQGSRLTLIQQDHLENLRKYSRLGKTSTDYKDVEWFILPVSTGVIDPTVTILGSHNYNYIHT